MKRLRQFLIRLFNSITRRRDDHFSEELEDHIAALTAENIRAGMTPTEARRQGILKFGPTETIKESYRGQQGLPILESVLWETRYALRRLRMAPAFTIATVLTLALGLGATTSIFTLVHAILLRSLPVARPDELYRLGKNLVVVIRADTARRKSSRLSLTICTNICGTIRGAFRN